MSQMVCCPVCQRKVREHDLTLHHWKPKSAGGTCDETMTMCRTCHDTLHYVIPIEEVENFDSVEKLQKHWLYGCYMTWIRSKTHPAMYKIKKALRQWLPKHLWGTRKYKNVS